MEVAKLTLSLSVAGMVWALGVTVAPDGQVTAVGGVRALGHLVAAGVLLTEEGITTVHTLTAVPPLATPERA